VADDHPVVREGLASVIKKQSDFIYCGGASSVSETYEQVKALRPDLVLLDLWLGGGDGLELIKSLKSQFPLLRILVISFSDEAVYTERALRAGAMGYVTKTQPTSELLTAIRTVLVNEIYVSPTAARLLLHKSVGLKRENTKRGTELLTDRELQVLQLLGSGLSTRKIAEELGVSFKTVETHRENLKHKLQLGDAVELVSYATGWVQEQQRPRLSPDDLLPTQALQN
jgi:DNA-binding NarL/FixJ family response regulator